MSAVTSKKHILDASAPIAIGLTPDHREAAGEILGQVLSDEYLLYTKSRNFHWNVVGPQFHDLHKFFESQYEELDDIVDDVAERMRSLGCFAPGSMAQFLGHTRLHEAANGHPMKSHDMVQTLLGDHESLIQSLRHDLDTCADKLHDMGTSDFLTGLLEKHEKMAWMLRAMLSKA